MSNLGNSQGNAVSSTREYVQTRGLEGQGNAVPANRPYSPTRGLAGQGNMVWRPLPPPTLFRGEGSPVYRYYVEIKGIIEGTFLECAGLNVTREPVPYEEGGVNDYVHQLPGRSKWGRLTLRRGYMFSKELWTWFEAGLYDGKVNYRDMSIITYHEDGSLSRRIDLKKAYPTKWTGPDLKSDSSAIAVETIEVVFHGITFTTGTKIVMQYASGYDRYLFTGNVPMTGRA
jgi:phage tail-like protein